jgi:hypothetical protein
MKDKTKAVTKDASKITKNLVEFTEAAALALVAGYAIWSALKVYELNSVFAYALAFAGALISIRAALLLVRHFNK